MKWFPIVLILTTLCGCAIGRSWDTPREEINQDSLNHLTGFTLYVDGYLNLIEKALSNGHSAKLENFILKQVSPENANEFPVLKVDIEPPEWDNSFTSHSFTLSGLTFGILPGYAFKSSKVIFQLTLPDESDRPITKSYNYAAQRHYFSWLPLIFAKNFHQTVQSWDEPALDWEKGYEELVRQFFQDSKPDIDKYLSRLGKTE